MKYYKLFFYCFLLIIPVLGFSQKQIIVETDSNYYKYVKEVLAKHHLKNLEEAKDSLNIRVWISGGYMFLELTKNEKITGTLTILCSSAKKQYEKIISLDEVTSKKLLDSLLFLQIKDLPHDGKRKVIDGNLYLFEIAEPIKYRQYSYLSPRLGTDSNMNNAYQIIKTIEDDLKVFNKFEKFLQDLPSGRYKAGPGPIMVDRFLDEKAIKSSGYAFVEQIMRKEMVITDNLHFPRIIINGKQDVFMKDLNQYKKTQIKNVKILTRRSEAAALYGSFGAKHGVVLITLNDKT
jgi:hypothetical protein